MISLINESTRECPTVKLARRIDIFGRIQTSARPMQARDIRKQVHGDEGPEKIASILPDGVDRLGAKGLHIGLGNL